MYHIYVYVCSFWLGYTCRDVCERLNMHISPLKFGLASTSISIGLLRAANSLNSLALALRQSLIYIVEPSFLMNKHCDVFFVQLAGVFFNFLNLF